MGSRYEHLSAEERGAIMAMRQQGASLRSVAQALNRATSTVAREVRRVRLGQTYDATFAGRQAARLRRQSRREHKLDPEGVLWKQVHRRLRRRWSPEQIAGKLRCVSHETIYTAIYAMPCGTLRRELTLLLRRQRAARRPKGRRRNGRPGVVGDMVSIHVRPPEANDRLLPGHWEGDLIKGTANRSAVGTLVDRNSLFVMLAKVEGASALAVLEGFTATFAPLPPELRKTLTYDQGSEMALHRKLAEGLGMKIYFCDPHSPWQRGINENTNGLLRDYLPKNANLSVHSQRDLDAIAWELNTRPRKSLGFRTPAEVFFGNYFKQTAANSPVALVP